MEIEDFEIENTAVTLFCADKADAPLILFNFFNSDGSEIVEMLSKMNTPDFNFLNVKVDDWNHHLSPWFCPSLYRSEPPFDGGADEFLSLLEKGVIPEALRLVNGRPSYIGISGYSLAGLFSLYAVCKSDSFDRAASMSGSLWFPEFVDFFKTALKRKPSRIYLSLGDKESSARNSILRTVNDKTLELYETVKEQGIECIFESNPGNHFFEPDKRSAKGIAWILKD